MNREENNNTYVNGLGEQLIDVVQEMSRVLSATQLEEIKSYIDKRVKLTIEEILGEVNPEYYTRIEAAKRLGISLVTLDKYINAGVIKSKRFGRNIRIASNDLNKALKERRNIKHK